MAPRMSEPIHFIAFNLFYYNQNFVLISILPSSSAPTSQQPALCTDTIETQDITAGMFEQHLQFTNTPPDLSVCS
jgi:hypothetical protein